MKVLKKGLRFFSSLKLTVFCLALIMLLVFLSTLAQVDLGIYYAKQTYFDGVFVWGNFFGYNLPYLPSGMSLGVLLFINLITAHFSRFKWDKFKIGIWLTHFGLMLLLLGAGLSQFFMIESQMQIKEGESALYSEHSYELELAIIEEVDGEHVVTVIPYSELRLNTRIMIPNYDLTIEIKDRFKNSVIRPIPERAGMPEQVKGIARQFSSTPMRILKRDDTRNISTVYAQISGNEVDYGIWLFSNGLSVQQPIQLSDAKTIYVSLRPKRFYNNYSIFLEDFTHDVYQGTTVPKDFSSKVTLTHLNTNESRDALIYMNHPLRFDGKTFFQASFAENDTVSILQVVQNPAWTLPYISSLIMAFGLVLQCLIYLNRFMKKRKA